EVADSGDGSGPEQAGEVGVDEAHGPIFIGSAMVRYPAIPSNPYDHLWTVASGQCSPVHGGHAARPRDPSYADCPGVPSISHDLADTLRRALVYGFEPHTMDAAVMIGD